MIIARSSEDAALGLAWLCGCAGYSLLTLLGKVKPADLWSASVRRLHQWGVGSRVALSFVERRDRFSLQDARARLAEAGIRFIAFGSPDYPRRLKHLACPPAGLFLRGEDETWKRLLRMPCLTIVGTRGSTPYGTRVVDAFARVFAARGVAVVSGMALGIDGRAHEAALHESGLTVAVLGCGADRPYPPTHRSLYDRICHEGIVLSELPPGSAPARWTFPRRNRLLAALGDATLVVEASVTSGALQTADWALELGRPVFAVPGNIDSPRQGGCNQLVYSGASPALEPGVTLEDFLFQTRIGRADDGVARTMSEPAPRPPEGTMLSGQIALGADRILEALAEGPQTVDSIIERTDLGARGVAIAIGSLEIVGMVRRVGPGLYIRAP